MTRLAGADARLAEAYDQASAAIAEACTAMAEFTESVETPAGDQDAEVWVCGRCERGQCARCKDPECACCNGNPEESWPRSI